MWSYCRIVALQKGPRQVVSRQLRKRRIAGGKGREAASIATSSSAVGWA